MIRRRVELDQGNGEFRLIAQDDHARLAGEMAARFGNARFAPPVRGDRTLLGVSMHDAGWPLHDDRPQLNDEGFPSDVFETPIERGVTVWEASAARAEAADPWAGLLVSIHVQRLGGRTDREVARLGNRDRFLLIRFRNDQAQRQMRLRTALDLRVDRPLDHGLALPTDAEAAADPAEQALAYDFRLLQAMDLLSLCACCTNPPAEEIGPLAARPGGRAVRIRVTRPSDTRLLVHPWPFAESVLMLSVPYTAVPARPYRDPADLHAAIDAGRRGSLDVIVEPVRRPLG